MQKLAKIMFSFGVLSAIALGCSRLSYGPEHFAPHVSKTTAIVSEKVLEKVGLKYYWEPICLDLQDGEYVTKMHCVGENLYFITSKNYLYCVDAATGLKPWSYKITNKIEKTYAPVHFENMRMPKKIIGEGALEYDYKKDCKPFDAVIINTETKIVVLNRKTGKAVRDFELTDQASCQAATDGKYFYYGNFRDFFICSVLLSTKPVWSEEIGSKPIRVPVRSLFNYIYAADLNGNIRGYGNGYARNLIWKKQLEGEINTAFVADLRGVFVGCSDGHLYALNRINGEELWSPVDLESIPNMPTQKTQNTVFQHTESKGLYAINLLDGAIRWNKSNAKHVITTINNQLYLLDEHNNLIAVDEITGNEKSSVPMTGIDFVAPSIGYESIFYATRNGHVFCLRSKGASIVTPSVFRMLK